MANFIEKLFRFEKRELDRLSREADQIMALDEQMSKLTDEELIGKTAEFKERLAKGETLESIKHEAFAVAREAGWRVSRYNLFAPIPGTKNVAIANLFKGVCAEYSPLELYLLSVLERLDEHHPIIDRFAKRGIITRLDERAALETMGRAACGAPYRR